nr:MAG TPA: hypothetical protein [Caudoviricetes sp.]
MPFNYLSHSITDNLLDFRGDSLMKPLTATFKFEPLSREDNLWRLAVCRTPLPAYPHADSLLN